MTLELQLDYERQFQWTQHGPFMFLGYTVTEDLVRKNAADFPLMFVPVQIEISNGCFAAVLLEDHELNCWTDAAASFPLFYKTEGDHLIITDFEGVLPSFPEQIDPNAKDAFLKLYCTESTDTLLYGWKAIPAGHRLDANLETGEISLHRYFNHFGKKKDAYQHHFEDACKYMFKEMSESMGAFCKDKLALVPLSGGYDSRLMLSLLVQSNHLDILCYTYGRKDSHEMEIASKVAEKLGLRHENIFYDKDTFSVYGSNDWKQYEQHNHHFQSLPHEQDYFALYELKKRGLLNRPFVAFPGYCGDITGGSFLKDFSIDPETYIRQLTNFEAKHLLSEQGIDGWDIYQQWLCENRLSKFIVNGVRVFEHFGGEWMLPLWHTEFLQKFYNVDHSNRLGQKAYLEIIFKLYFEPLGIDFRKPSNDTPTTSKTWKDTLKETLPEQWVASIRKRNRKGKAADPCNLHLLYDIIYEQMRQSGRYDMPEKDYNINFLRAYQWLCCK